MSSNKIILLGDSGVGKTTILHNFLDLSIQPEVTIGVQHHSFTRNNIKFSIWDTAGQERYRAIVSSHYKRAKAAILVYDCSNEQTLQHLDKWIEELTFQVGSGVVLALIGNKTDLQKVDMNEQVQSLQEKYEIAYHTQTNHKDPEFKDKVNKLLDEIGKNLGLLDQNNVNSSNKKELIFTLKEPETRAFQGSLHHQEEQIQEQKKIDLQEGQTAPMPPQPADKCEC